MAFTKASLTRKARYVRDAIDILEEMGFKVELEKGDHAKVYVTANGKSIRWSASLTPSSPLTPKNELMELKRKLVSIGVEPPRFQVRGAPTTEHNLNRLWFVIDQAEADLEDEQESKG